jgi:hypothetical protein
LLILWKRRQKLPRRRKLREVEDDGEGEWISEHPRADIVPQQAEADSLSN